MPRNRNDRPDPRMNGRRDYDEDDRRKKNGMNMKKIFGISFCIVLGIVVISGAVIYRLGHDITWRMRMSGRLKPFRRQLWKKR